MQRLLYAYSHLTIRSNALHLSQVCFYEGGLEYKHQLSEIYA